MNQFGGSFGMEDLRALAKDVARWRDLLDSVPDGVSMKPDFERLGDELAIWQAKTEAHMIDVVARAMESMR